MAHFCAGRTPGAHVYRGRRRRHHAVTKMR